MTKAEAIEMLNAIEADSDPEIEHQLADEALLDVLRELGADDVADAWAAAKKRCQFWYA